MSRHRARILIVLAISSLILPALYLGIPSLAGQLRTPAGGELRYSDAQESGTQVEAILASLAKTMDTKDLSLLRGRLKGVVQLPGVGQDPLKEYLRVLSEFSGNMAQIETKMSDARVSLASRDVQRSRADLDQLKHLRDETKPLLWSLPRLLSRVEDYYKVDASAQREKVGELESVFSEYSAEIAILDDEIGVQQGLIRTILTLNSSKQQVFVEEDLSMHGVLEMWNGTALVGRNVTLSWNNMTLMRTTDFSGKFEAELSFPIGAEAGSNPIEAKFEPQGSDSSVYLPCNATLEVKVAYRPSVIVAEIKPATSRPLDPVEVSGILRDLEDMPLENRTIETSFNDVFVGNTATNATGHFLFGFPVPITANSGTHVVTVAFAPTLDRYSGSNVTLTLAVELHTTRTEILLDRTTVFSGTTMTVSGTVTLTNGTAWRYGRVHVYLDDSLLTNAVVMEDGSFLLAAQVPPDASFGSHAIRVQYSPDEAWVEGSEAVAQVYVYNTLVLLIAVVGVAAASSLSAYAIVRGRRAAKLSPLGLPGPPSIVTPPTREEYSTEDLTAAIQAEHDDAAKVRRSYRLAQSLLEQSVGEAPRESETHWEYLSRIVSKSPGLADPLRRLVELYELAEYSPFPIGTDQSSEAMEIVLRLREQA